MPWRSPAHGPAELLRAGHRVRERQALQGLEELGIGAGDLPDPLGDVEVVDLVDRGGEPVMEPLAVLVEPVVDAEHVAGPMQPGPGEASCGEGLAEGVPVAGRRVAAGSEASTCGDAVPRRGSCPCRTPRS